jgi:hypothetical protein
MRIQRLLISGGVFIGTIGLLIIFFVWYLPNQIAPQSEAELAALLCESTFMTTSSYARATTKVEFAPRTDPLQTQIETLGPQRYRVTSVVHTQGAMGARTIRYTCALNLQDRANIITEEFTDQSIDAP